MLAMFAGCTIFNSPLTFDTSAVTTMQLMFQNATAFQQNIGSWNISNVTNFTNFMTSKTPATWPTTYFDNLLCGWSSQTVVPSLTIDFGTASYTTLTGGPCRTVLQAAPKLWTINSGPGV
jgi:surface protein